MNWEQHVTEHMDFSFRYGETEAKPHLRTVTLQEKTPDAEQLKVVYQFDGGLRITKDVTIYPKYQAVRWVLWIENTSDWDSPILSELFDCDFFAELPCTLPVKKTGYSLPEGFARILRMTGTTWSENEFSTGSEVILPGETKRYCTGDGVSSQGVAPFFHISSERRGIVCAIGWSGQWNARFTCVAADDVQQGIRFQAGIEDVAFQLKPGERIRTASVVLMPYEGEALTGQNQWKRLMREHFSLIGRPGRPQEAPFCMMLWGGMHSDQMIKRINAAMRQQTELEYVWIDAGWYGSSEQECPSEHVPDWGYHVGEWYPNSLYHPHKLLDVAAAVKRSGLKLLLWMEPELAIRFCKTAEEHPDWFYTHEETELTYLLNLSIPEAFEFAYRSAAEQIEALGLDCFRQDFCCFPLKTWRKNDLPQRRGLYEIKHIMGLYALWDRLLQNYPNLVIDNCAGGGRRLDIELASRSVAMWRSDHQCLFDADPEITQMQNTGVSAWLPYTGTGAGFMIGDTYHFRSCYSSSLTVAYWGYDEFKAAEDGDESMRAWLQKVFAEYKRARPYFSCDYYPLIPHSMSRTSWCAWQYHRPETGDGIVMAFRRSESPHDRAALRLYGLAAGQSYVFENADTGALISVTAPAASKKAEAFPEQTVTLPQRRTCVLFFYQPQ